MGICQSIFQEFYAISLHVWRNEFLNPKFHSDHIFPGSSLFFSYSEGVSVIYNNRNYGSLPYILFMVVQIKTVELPWIIDHNALQYAQNSKWRCYC